MLGCDALVMLGTDFPYRQFYPTDAKIVQIDIRGERLGNRTPLTMGLVGDVQSTIAALLPRLRQKVIAAFSTRRFDTIKPRAKNWMISR
jgi:pyruvate dehydrogenase (quinone)